MTTVATGQRGPDGDFAVPVGELLAVIGPAGPGRSGMLAGIGGRMRLRGGPAHPVRRRVGVARTFGAAAPDRYDRVGELLDLAAVQAGRRIGAPDVTRALAAAGLRVEDHPPADAPPGVLPRGTRYEHLSPVDQLLLTVALALIPRPDALLVDGVDAPPDEPAAHRVWATLHDLTTSVPLVAAATTSPSPATSFAHRTIFLPT
ncbi:ABC transporter ATP-binding protein [Streptomyces sp. CA-111067]|uniref:ABC transporter ATP-binding protein n=1 Tax=Streptomyces sp. CA-111067 TaxID=3240046 RepID=UPI003D97FFF2